MTGINLGYRATTLNVALADDTDFVSALVATEAWPVGTAITLEFLPVGQSPIAWPATIDDTRASWHVPAATVAPILASAVREVRLRYTDADGTVLVWAHGTILRGPR